MEKLNTKDYAQVRGLDFRDTFPPVVNLITVRCLFTMAAKTNWSLYEMDAYNAFLNGGLEEEIYMESPPECK